MTNWKKGDVIYYVFSNGDKSPCKCLEFDNKGNIWVKWLHDGFIDIMPSNRFVKNKADSITEQMADREIFELSRNRTIIKKQK